MAPPKHRRPGFSRRAQYGLFAGYVIATIGVVIALAAIAAWRLDPTGFALVRGAALDATAPLTAAGASVSRGLSDMGAEVGAYWNAGARNRQMTQEVATMRSALVQARAARFENARLKRLLKLVDRTPETIVSTRIIGSTASGTRRLATIAAGSGDGVRPGQPVRSGEGLVGRIFETGRGAARLLMLTDTGSTVPVRLARNGLPALVTGNGDGRLRVRPLIAGENPFRRGDLLLTSGTGGLYPPNVPVAVITGADALTPLARPLADPDRTDFVLVQAIYAPEAAAPPPGLPTTAGTAGAP
ncbi:rod shape-determining protein MreC [Sphingomonas prati]|uniref:Cell shape-determining protein MreC n=1 Tax=Sphingomonas prati TaxID=1843237 RepID=A0A7W9BSP6_9SPHN|nr:rod shape-determining protein MreC [Sphingomonas prati]MBB5729296.1 rod shape-determining protein MreC [Sphingomonas prati]GGE78549.1 rod shape-determining protein MreC [Sphingomonas prati]